VCSSKVHTLIKTGSKLTV